MLQAFDQLDPPTQAIAKDVISAGAGSMPSAGCAATSRAVSLSWPRPSPALPAPERCDQDGG
jgi:hypothetical protein